MKNILLSILLLGSHSAIGQSIDLDTIDFSDETRFTSKINYKKDGAIRDITYIQKNGTLRKIEFYNQRRITNVQIWNPNLISDIKYTYKEKGRVVNRFDVLNKKQLISEVVMYIDYPPMAREEGIEGVAKYHLTFDENCIPKSFQMFSNLGHGIEKEVGKELKNMIRLSKKYKIPFNNCHMAKDTLQIRFKLE